MHRFHLPDFVSDREMWLPGDEAHHLARVLRLSPGDVVAVFDGKGHEALARVESVAPHRVCVKVMEAHTPAPEPAVAITLAQALLKRDGMERVIRDAVMLGVSAIQPFVSQRTEVPRAALRKGARRDRWDRTVLSSVKQCGRAVVPQVLETKELGELLAMTPEHARVMFVEPGGMDAADAVDLRSLEAQRPVGATVFIGPEGGWDRQEVKDALTRGVTLVTLGRRVLRADAAGAAALAVLRYAWRDL